MAWPVRFARVGVLRAEIGGAETTIEVGPSRFKTEARCFTCGRPLESTGAAVQDRLRRRGFVVIECQKARGGCGTAYDARLP